ILHLPYCANESRECMCLAELFFVEKFSNWPDRPLVRPLQDNAGEKICMLVARERACDVQVGGAPVPPCEMIAATLAPKRLLLMVSGKRAPNSVAMLGPA